jgi:hypothetical protein
MSHITPIRFSLIPVVLLASDPYIVDNVSFKFGGKECLFILFVFCLYVFLLFIYFVLLLKKKGHRFF